MVFKKPEHLREVGRCPDCGGIVRCEWTSKVGMGQYYCEDCGDVTNHFRGIKPVDIEEIKQTFIAVVAELNRSGVPYPNFNAVCRITMTKLGMGKLIIKDLPSWGFKVVNGTVWRITDDSEE